MRWPIDSDNNTAQKFGTIRDNQIGLLKGLYLKQREKQGQWKREKRLGLRNF